MAFRLLGQDSQVRIKPIQNSQEQARSGILYLTQRKLERQFGAETSRTRLQKRVGSSGRIPCVARRWFACRDETASSISRHPISAAQMWGSLRFGVFRSERVILSGSAHIFP